MSSNERRYWDKPRYRCKLLSVGHIYGETDLRANVVLLEDRPSFNISQNIITSRVVSIDFVKGELETVNTVYLFKEDVVHKKDFQAVADLLNKWVREDGQRALLFSEFATVFAREYPNFDRKKWFDASVTASTKE